MSFRFDVGTFLSRAALATASRDERMGASVALVGDGTAITPVVVYRASDRGTRSMLAALVAWETARRNRAVIETLVTPFGFGPCLTS